MQTEDLVLIVFFYLPISIFLSAFLEHVMGGKEYMRPWERVVRSIIVALPILISVATAATVAILTALQSWCDVAGGVG